MIYLYVCLCFILPWSVESFPFMSWRWRNKLKWAPFELVAPASLLGLRSWLHPFKGHCEQKSMRDEGVIYVAGHPLLNRRCTRLPGYFYFPKRKLYLIKARYSLTVLKVLVNSNQSINQSGFSTTYISLSIPSVRYSVNFCSGLCNVAGLA